MGAHFYFTLASLYDVMADLESELPLNQRLVINESWHKQRKKFLASCKVAAMSQCAICGHSFSNSDPPHVDHCHKSHKFRGFLCSSCNKMLGFAKDDIGVLRAAIRYLGGRPGR